MAAKLTPALSLSDGVRRFDRSFVSRHLSDFQRSQELVSLNMFWAWRRPWGRFRTQQRGLDLPAALGAFRNPSGGASGEKTYWLLGSHLKNQ